MRFTSFPSFIGSLVVPLALLALTAPPTNFASAAAAVVDMEANADNQSRSSGRESIARHSQWLNDKFGSNLQQSQSQLQNQNQQFQKTRRDQSADSTADLTFVTDPLGTQFTFAEMDEFEAEIRVFESNTSNADPTFSELISPKSVFINQCVDVIVSLGKDDDLISQNDATEFLVDFCISVGECDAGYTTSFQALNHRLQLSFTRFVCPFVENGPQDQVCLDELEAQGDQFGYVIKADENMTVLEDKVRGMCFLFWKFGTGFHGGTESPTMGPSGSPSLEPSGIPSVSPTWFPSAAPTVSPTFVPTSSPSSLPTFVPSVEPSMDPSSGPTVMPSSAPYGTPSLLPSASPSSSPSASPSNLPTGIPSSTPSSTPSSFPTTMPSSVPSMSPSSLPSSEPSHRPSLPPGVSMAPSSTPTFTPSSTPTSSQAPTLSQQPSSSPSQTVVFRVDFTYIIGFNNTSITARSLDDATKDIQIMDEIRQTIVGVLALDGIFRRQLRSQLQLDLHVSGSRELTIGFRGQSISAVFHKRLADEESCPESFTASLSCVRVVSEAIVYANPETYSRTQVQNSVRGPIKESMDGNPSEFVELMDVNSLREVKYVGGGSIVGDPLDQNDSDRNPIVSSGGVAGIAVGAIFLVAAIALFVATRSRADDDREEPPEIQSSDESYNSDLDPEIEVPTGGMKGLAIVEGTEKDPLMDPLDTTHAHQIDIETGAAILPVVTSGGDNDSDGSSKYSGSDEESDILIGRLDAAVSAGDWAAVAAIAGDLSTADEASSMSSVNTSKYRNTAEKYGLDAANKKRAATIDQLIAEGDWNAVGATAAAFDDGSSSGASSSMKSEKNSEMSSKNISSNDGTKKSIIDFIAGPWQSSAASKAMVNDHDDANPEDLNISTQSDAISSLSGGISPDRMRDSDLELGAAAFQPMIHVSESDTTDDDTRPMLGNPKKEKKGWKGRIPIIRRKKDAAEKTAAKSLALQEDSSVSSWSEGSPESNAYTPYSTVKAKAQDEIPEEMKAFGEDFGLAAAELAMRQEEEAKQNADDNDSDNNDSKSSSPKSYNSLRDELDRAIESGDWEAVEAQTNKLFDVNMDHLEDEPSPRKRGHHSSGDADSYDSDGDNSREGWSTTSKSMTSGHSEPIDDERIAMLEKLIETDDWQGIVSTSRLHNRDDSSMASSALDDDSGIPEDLLSPRDDDDTDDEEQSM